MRGLKWLVFFFFPKFVRLNDFARGGISLQNFSSPIVGEE